MIFTSNGDAACLTFLRHCSSAQTKEASVTAAKKGQTQNTARVDAVASKVKILYVVIVSNRILIPREIGSMVKMFWKP